MIISLSSFSDLQHQSLTLREESTERKTSTGSTGKGDDDPTRSGAVEFLEAINTNRDS